MKRVLLTGISGFVASHIFEHIMKNTDWEVIGLHRSSRAGSMERIEEILKNHPEWVERTDILHHDLRDAVPSLMDGRLGHIDYVLHTGASSHVDESIKHPLEFCKDNVVGTVNLLDWLRMRKETDPVERFIYFSTDEVYGNALNGEFHDEEYPHRPRNPYAASKAAAEDFCHSYRVTYSLPILMTNTMNIVGERQHPEKYVPLVMGKLLRGEKLSIHGYPGGEQAGSRFYLHARNCAAALLFVLEHGEVGEKYNVVGEIELDNLEIAQMIEEFVAEWTIQRAGPDAAVPQLDYAIVDFHSSRPGHDLRYALDGTKLGNMGYTHPVDFKESLRKTVFWTLDNDHWLG